MPTQHTPSRFLALDGLRGLAAVYVVIYHTPWQSHLTDIQFFANGYLAVDLFFVISGFVIAWAYADRIRAPRDMRDFLLLRFFRVYPVHAFTLAVLLVPELHRAWAFYWGGGAGARVPFTGVRSSELLAAHVFLVQGLGFTDIIGWNAPSWSISCEFVAYIAFAFAVFAAPTRRFLRPPVLVAVSLGLYAAMLLRWESFAPAPVPRCLAGFILGVALSRWSAEPRVASAMGNLPARVRAGLEIVVAGSTLAVLALCSGSLALMAAPLFGAAVFVFASGPGPIWRFLVSRPVQHLGRVSYSLYMLHAVVFVRLSPLLRTGGRPATEILLPDQRLVVVSDPFAGDCLLAGGLALVLVLSHLLYLWIEEPCRQFGRTLVARLRPAAVLPGVPA